MAGGDLQPHAAAGLDQGGIDQVAFHDVLGGPMKRAMKQGWKMYATGAIGFPESVSMNYYKTALLWLADEGYCERSADRSRVVTIANNEGLQELHQHLRRYLDKVVIPRRAKTFHR